MTGILKVDTIQKNNGSTPTAADLGLNISGSIVQVVQDRGDSDPEAYTTSTSFVSTGTYATITPKFITSKILIFVNGGLLSVNNSGNYAYIKVFRNGSDVFDTDGRVGNAVMNGMASLAYIDSPNTIASVTYRVYLKSSTGGGVQLSNHATQSPRVTLFEVAV